MSAAPQLKAGDTVYNKHGQEPVFILRGHRARREHRHRTQPSNQAAAFNCCVEPTTGDEMNTQNHFEFVDGDEITISPGRTVKRIRALAAIAAFGVVPGDLGGYAETLDNLCGNAWVSGDARVSGNARVSGDARVYGNARVSGNARVYGNARVSGNAWVSGDARVHGNAQVSGDARVHGNAQVSGNAWVHGDAWVSGDARVSGNALVSGNARVHGDGGWLLIGPARSSERFTTAHIDKKIGVRVNCGCFTGSVLEFSQAIEKTHANNQKALHQYRLFCQLIAFNFGVEAAMQKETP